MRTQSMRLWTAVLCGAAGIALAASAKDTIPKLGERVEFSATVTAVREVPVGDALPGLHLDARVKGRMTDIYIAPMDFVAKYGVKIAKGDDVQVEGTLMQAGDVDLVLAREITTGSRDKNGFFRGNLTTYLRNDNGPLFDEPKAAPSPVSVY